MAPFQAFTFALIPGECFLRSLPGHHQLSPDKRTLTLNSCAQSTIGQLTKPEVLMKLARALQDIKAWRRRSRARKAVDNDAPSGSEDES
ncbi:hypothetical protein C8Q73DRAFT_673811 [Cubamyces lactineus]|nr:hypothetical protein C8Q73DRAFT_673811 [Cubamyces lactineus]